jgi:hypothetical protein
MSEFLMIVPDGWGEVADGQAFVDQHTETQLQDLIARGELAAIEAMLQDGGYIPMDSAMLDFRLFRDGGSFRVWYLLG